MRALLLRLYRRSRADRWSSLFGQVAVYSFVVTAITGVFLLFYYKPSMSQVSYHGSYRKLDGVQMSQAYRSTLDISFDVRGGLLMRQLHHWAALLFIAAVCAHLLRLYFTGGFRRPRWLNWLIWVTLLVLGMVAGLSGTILPDDMLSSGSLGVLEGVTLSVPVIGTHLMLWIFGGDFPGHAIIPRAYWLHVAVLPAVMIALLALLRRRGKPVITPVSVAMFWFTCATLALLGTFAQVNPVWLVGPSQPGSISAGSVPGWYMGFLDGALRIMPGWEISVFGHPLTLAVLVPGVLVPGAFFTVLAAYPLLDRRLTGDPAGDPVGGPPAGPAARRRETHRVRRRRDHLLRTAVGGGGQRRDRLSPRDLPLRGHLVLPGGGAGRPGPGVHGHRADVPRPGPAGPGRGRARARDRTDRDGPGRRLPRDPRAGARAAQARGGGRAAPRCQ